MNKLIIDRAKWRTGGAGLNQSGIGVTRLLNEEGFMCCLGFECLRLGQTEEQIYRLQLPRFRAPFELLNDPSFDPTHWITIAVETNDAENLTHEQRESRIIEHFKLRNVQVEFIGEYVHISL